MKQSCEKFVPILYSMIIWSRIDHEQTKNNALSNQKISKKSIFQSFERNFWNWILLRVFSSWNYQFTEWHILIIFVFKETKLCKKRFQKISLLFIELSN